METRVVIRDGKWFAIRIREGYAVEWLNRENMLWKLPSERGSGWTTQNEAIEAIDTYEKMDASKRYYRVSTEDQKTVIKDRISYFKLCNNRYDRHISQLELGWLCYSVGYGMTIAVERIE